MPLHRRRSRFARGPALFIFGSRALLFIIAAAAVELWPDPNPNPVGPGMLAALTLRAAVIWLGV